MAQHRIAIIVGSIRKDSLNRKVARAICGCVPDSLDCRIVEIGDLPLYDPDLDGGEVPAAWTRFRDEVRNCDGVLWVSPEYNRSIPGALKNAIDVGSRPYGQSVFAKKPAAVVTASPGNLGGFGCNHHIRQCCVFLDMPVMAQPETYLSQVSDETFHADGTVADEKLAGLLDKLGQAFAGWVDLIHAGRAALAPDIAGATGS